MTQVIYGNKMRAATNLEQGQKKQMYAKEKINISVFLLTAFEISTKRGL